MKLPPSRTLAFISAAVMISAATQVRKLGTVPMSGHQPFQLGGQRTTSHRPVERQPTRRATKPGLPGMRVYRADEAVLPRGQADHEPQRRPRIVYAGQHRPALDEHRISRTVEDHLVPV